jgi:hypothetical protein
MLLLVSLHFGDFVLNGSQVFTFFFTIRQLIYIVSNANGRRPDTSDLVNAWIFGVVHLLLVKPFTVECVLQIFLLSPAKVVSH